MSSPVLAFTTVFLSLVLGEQTVELTITDPVHAVEVRLDGELVERRKGPPWRVLADFGSDLVPHRLEAVAFDEDEEELARVTQWINLPQPSADASVIIERDEDGTSWARLTWTNVLREAPVAIRFSFDGQPLVVEDPRRIPLPAHDLSQLHFVRAEIEFPQSVSTLVEVTFGGSFSGQVNAELTALPIHLDSSGRTPSAGELREQFVSGQGVLAVAAIDKGPAEIVIIRDQEVQQRLDLLSRERRRRGIGLGASGYATRFSDRLRTDQNIGLMWPFMQLNASGIWTFPPTYGWLSSRDGGVSWFLANFKPMRTEIDKQQLTDAVAVAGMNALARNRRRAVVLILGERPIDNSRLDPQTVRGYLRHLGVPLFVWSPFPQPHESPWGPVEQISNPTKFRAAVTRLSESVDRQRIVWFEGRHLPQDVRLVDRTAGFTLRSP